MIVLAKPDQPKLAELLKLGNVGVIPTDTVYGLVAAASDKQAAVRLYKLKQREGKPGTLIAANISQLVELGLDEVSLRVAEKFWPNPLSVIIPASPNLGYLDQGLGALAVRIPVDQPLRELLQATGPLITSSANQPGKPPANTLREAQAYFGGEVDFYLDGGDLSGRESSTVARISNGRLQIVRPGAFVPSGLGS